MSRYFRGDINQGTNRIFTIDSVDGSPKLFAEVFGYSRQEIECNVSKLLAMLNHHTQTPL